MLFHGESQMTPEDHLKSLPWLARCFERVGEASMKNAVGSCCVSWIPMGTATGRTRDPKMFFCAAVNGCIWYILCWKDWKAIWHRCSCSWNVFPRCMRIGTWILWSLYPLIRSVHSAVWIYSCVPGLPFFKFWNHSENCYSRGKDWWKSDEVVPLQGGVAFGKQPDSWCSQYKWQICMHW